MLVNWTRPYDRAGVPVTSFELDCHSENGVKCSISASTAEIVSETGVHTVTVDSHNGESRCLCSIRSHANGLWSPWSPSAPEICVRSETRNWTVTMDGYRYLHPALLPMARIFLDFVLSKGKRYPTCGRSNAWSKRPKRPNLGGPSLHIQESSVRPPSKPPFDAYLRGQSQRNRDAQCVSPRRAAADRPIPGFGRLFR
ncbi:unnamed protein product [Notodromas monacha]|uniref:Uncharacterized protein n=1 Tax=Notodromas monacha TaxID=399045 RepID=A0A7R9GJJ9_9CRUS|nr:unnamed protein product [Notodromas monacha]CAG0925064.1 unnamed protein product [Notodromas monacha]